jgi:hypothetical protein
MDFEDAVRRVLKAGPMPKSAKKERPTRKKPRSG